MSGPLDLEPIRARSARAQQPQYPGRSDDDVVMVASANDVPDLLAEVDQLRSVKVAARNYLDVTEDAPSRAARIQARARLERAVKAAEGDAR